jgi:hypothetical protein
VTPLSNDTILGAGAVYQAIGLWNGHTLRPAPHVIAERFQAKNCVAWFQTSESLSDDSAPALCGLISPQADGMTVRSALRVMGTAGATGGCIFASDFSAAALAAIAAGDDVGELGGAVSLGVRDMASAATDITDIASVLVRNWPIVLIGAVAAWALLTGRIKV